MLTKARGKIRKTIGGLGSSGDRRRINSLHSRDENGEEGQKIKEE